MIDLNDMPIGAIISRFIASNVKLGDLYYAVVDFDGLPDTGYCVSRFTDLWGVICAWLKNEAI